MRFWDTSALVPLLVPQSMSSRAEEWFAEDPLVVVWTLTPVEVVSAVWRLVRENALTDAEGGLVEERLDDLVLSALVVLDVDTTKRLARRLLRLHALRAFDALQLAAAVQWVDGRSEGQIFHTFDARLGLAARREGFVVPA